MKTIFKILVILVVAVLVGGLFYGVVTATSSGSGQSSIAERSGGGFGHHEQGNAGGIQFPADAIKNLAIISIVSIIFLNTSKLLKRKKSAVNVRL